MRHSINIEHVDKNLAVEYIRKYHYSKIMPRLTKHYLGIIINDSICGIITLGWGTQPLKTIRKIFYKHELLTKDYFEIGKMCFDPKYNNDKNFGSQAIKAIINWMKYNTDCLFLYTLADGIMGKCGYVYQASNFKYLGKFETCVYLDNTTGEKIHPRSSKQLLIENAEFENKDKLYWLTYEFLEHKNLSKIFGYMFRYIYALNKDAYRILNEYPEYGDVSNPKDSDLKFYKRIANRKKIEIKQPTFNMNVFNYNYQKVDE